MKYAVEWTAWVGPDEDFSQYAVKDGFEKLTIITCIGTFDPNTRHYSNRYLVRATPIS